jgi:hypothetical protein
VLILTPSLLERLRRATALRVVLLVAALMVAQSGIVCLCDSPASAPETAQVAGMQAPVEGEDCCAMCTDCAQCGGCHTSAVSPRSDSGPALLASITGARIAAATAARAPWTPPAHYRPPIDNA